MINPIRRHGSYKEIEDAVFNMRDGEISPVIQAGGQYVILKREEAIAAQTVSLRGRCPEAGGVPPRPQDAGGRPRRLPRACRNEPNKQKAIQIVWNDPAKRQKMPGVAATGLRRPDHHPRVGRGVHRAPRAGSPRRHDQPQDHRTGMQETERRRDRRTTSTRKSHALAAAGVKAKPDGSPDVEAWLDVDHEAGHFAGRLSQRRRLAVAWP